MTDTTNIATLLAPERLRETVVSALVDGRIFQRFARGDDQPEDLAVDLLREHNSGAVRNSVLAGVRVVWLVLQEALVQPDCNPDAPARKGSLPLGEIVSHFGALLNRAAPKELEALPYSLLEIVLHPDADRVLYGPLVRAALAYAHSERRAPFWETQAVEELVPGWAFKALAQIDAEHPRMLRLLVLCWTKALSKQTTADPVIITNEVASKRKDPAAFRRELWRSVVRIAHQSGQHKLFVERWDSVTMQAEEKLALASGATATETPQTRFSMLLRRREILRKIASQSANIRVFYGGGHPIKHVRTVEPSTVYVQYHGGKLVVHKTGEATVLGANSENASTAMQPYVEGRKSVVLETRILSRAAHLESLRSLDEASIQMREARAIEVGNEPGEHSGQWKKALMFNSDIEDIFFQKIADEAIRQVEGFFRNTYIGTSDRSRGDKVAIKDVSD